MNAVREGQETFTATVRQFSERTGIGYNEANALTKVLMEKGVVTDTGDSVKPESGKGKSSKLYEYPKKVNLEL